MAWFRFPGAGGGAIDAGRSRHGVGIGGDPDGRISVTVTPAELLGLVLLTMTV